MYSLRTVSSAIACFNAFVASCKLSAVSVGSLKDINACVDRSMFASIKCIRAIVDHPASLAIESSRVGLPDIPLNIGRSIETAFVTAASVALWALGGLALGPGGIGISRDGAAKRPARFTSFAH